MHKKLNAIPIIALLLLSANIDLAHATTISSDSFASLPNGWTITGTVTTDPAGVSGQAPNASPAGNPFAIIYSSSSLQRTFSTSGYEDIIMRYYRTPLSFEASGGISDYYAIDWKLTSSGIWTNLETLDNSPGLNNNWTQAIFNLPASADNSSIDVRFRVVHVTGNANDYGLLDNFELLGDYQNSGSPYPTIPEPATMAIFGLGISGLVYRGKFKIQNEKR